jgi:hypothetical protein
MMQVTGQRNVPCLFGEVHQIGHELAIEKYRRQIDLFDVEFLLLDRRNDGLR